jgi:HK97 family phage major capsid protein
MKDKLKKLRAQIKVLAVKADLTDAEDVELKSLMSQAVKLEGQIEAAAQAAKGDDEEKAIAEAAVKAAVDDAVKAEKAKWEAEAAKSRRLPMGEGAPYQAQFAETWKYDALEAADLALVVDTLRSAGGRPSGAALKALMLKTAELKGDNSEASEQGLTYVRGTFKAAHGFAPTVDAIKGVTDPMLTTGTTDGGNWVYALYSNELWRSMRADNQIVSKIPSIVIPDGYSSAYFPIEGTDPTWYHVAEAATAGTNVPSDATITASQITTPTKVQLSVNKMGARVMYSGEIDEDSMIPFAAQLREQLQLSGAEVMEAICINGDTSADATNINHTSGSAGGTEYFTILDGFRHLAIITNAANSRSGGALSEDDYLETMWLMGTAGLAGADLAKCSFIIDPNVYKASLKMATVKTKDVWTNATMESGVLTKLWGYDIYPSWNFASESTTRKTNSAGEVDEVTAANNAYGCILGVRWDQWKLGYKRRMSIETTRFANSDSWEIVALARWGLMYRDVEAAAVTYGITV